MKIWQCDSFSVYSDGEKFIAQLQAGITGETYLSVGYSSPNGAIPNELADRNFEVRNRLPSDIGAILVDVLQCYYETELQFLDFDQMLPELFKLASLANEVYNKFLCNENQWNELREFYIK